MLHSLLFNNFITTTQKEIFVYTYIGIRLQQRSSRFGELCRNQR